MINHTTVPVGEDEMETVSLDTGEKREVVVIGGPDGTDKERIAAVLGVDTTGAEMGLAIREVRQRRIKNVFAAINHVSQTPTLDVSSVSPNSHTVSVAPVSATSYIYELLGAIDGTFYSLSGQRNIANGVADMVSVDGRPVDQIRINVIDLQGVGATLTPTYLGVA